jgi:prepilin-type N-terminal cleavage/methylation domain-containing protein
MHVNSHTNGFTFIEVIIVLALVVVIGRYALLVSFDTYRDSSYHTDRSSLIGILQHARAESINSICEGNECTGGVPHGVSIQADRYVLFQGASYASRDSNVDSIFEVNPTISHSGLSEILFASVSGNVAHAGDVTLTDLTGHTSTITIGSEGQISWSN